MHAAVVTGATSGIGRACVELLLRAGKRVVAIGRREQRLAEIARIGGAAVHAVACDVRDRAGLEAARAALPERFGGIDLLINNAGLMLGEGPLDSVGGDDVDTMLATNIEGVLNATRLFSADLARSRGHIINIGSIAGSYHYAGGHIYAGTKAFVAQFSRCLRAELAGRGVRVSCVCPGRTSSEFSLVRFKGDAARANGAGAGITPLAAEDVARAVLWVYAQPAHVNVSEIEIVPAGQTLAFA